MKTNPFISFCILLVILIVSGCTTPPPVANVQPTALSSTQAPPAAQTTRAVQASSPQPGTPTFAPITTIPDENARETPSSLTQTLVSQVTLHPDDWKQLPPIPSISNTVIEIYQRGLEAGNNPQAFSKIGDCGSTPAWFLGDFDRGTEFYRLGAYQGLQKVIDYYKGSFARTSLAAQSGYNASSLFVTLWSDRTYCKATEAPLECEYRVHRPIIAFIMLGTNDVYRPLDFEPQMRRIIEFSLESGVIPILSTKADNAEKDFSINATIARLAYEYDIPLWNFWAAVQILPDGGLQEDEAHLTWGRNFFDDPEAMTKAWPIRNLTALQMLNAIWQKVNTTSKP